MSILKVARMGHPVLRRKADPFTVDEIVSADGQRLVRDMIHTMVEYQGVGLAGPQVHVPKRVIVVHAPDDESEDDEVLILFNPEIKPLDNDRAVGWEGCLSIPDIRGEVSRYLNISVTALGKDGKPMTFDAHDFPARVIQHEVDHLDGVLYLDRMDDMSSLTFLDEFHKFARDGDDDEDSE